jgi:hypothetical protein
MKKFFALIALVILPNHSIAEVVQKFNGSDALAILEAGKIINFVMSDVGEKTEYAIIHDQLYWKCTVTRGYDFSTSRATDEYEFICLAHNPS